MQAGFGINKLQQEAQTRWLKPSEVHFILQNHECYPVSHEAPNRPPSGSLFLFNRRVLRFFRKDGYMWRKKKDGRTVGEAHERLKVANVDALNCYYAHGEQNPSFQRRSYWMLDPAYEHMVLVHYREVSEGRNISGTIPSTTPKSLTSNQTTNNSNPQINSFRSESNEFYGQYQNSASPRSIEEVSSESVLENYVGLPENLNSSSQPEVNKALRKIAEQLSLDGEDNSIFGEELPPCCSTNEEPQDLGPVNYDTRASDQDSCGNVIHGYDYRELNQVEYVSKRGNYSGVQLIDFTGGGGKQHNQIASSTYDVEFGGRESSWKDMIVLDSNSADMDAYGRTNFFALENVPEALNRTLALGSRSPAQDTTSHQSSTFWSPSEEEGISMHLNEQSEMWTWDLLDHEINGTENFTNDLQISDSEVGLQLGATKNFLLGSEIPVSSPASHLPEVEESHNNTYGAQDLEAQPSMMLKRGNSSDWVESMTLAVENRTYSSDFSGLWFDQSHLETPLAAASSLTLSQKQRFSIREVSPEWGFTSERTKVFIIGDFLCHPSENSWAVMFDDSEVPAEVVQEGVLRCHTPQHGAGKVTLCITSSNRESCSEVREFEFRAHPTSSNSFTLSGQKDARKNTEELVLLVRFIKMLLCKDDCIAATPLGGLGREVEPLGDIKLADYLLEQSSETFLLGGKHLLVTINSILQELLNDKLQQWLLSKRRENANNENVLSKEEQGIIHIISGLGYEWALNPILSSGIGINFRDVNGWTALHWAARFGREKMVAALLAAGASAGAVTDPISRDPAGKTPASIAAACGYKGLAGYLSEVALTSHLSSLTLGESEISRVSAEVDAERAVETISQRCAELHVSGTEDLLSLKDSLAAVRNAAQAAARIQSAFRAHSFRKRQQKAALIQDEYGMTQEEIHGLSAASKLHRSFHGSRDLKLDKAALSIQKKYRGWKGRKDFLTLRQKVVKIQAHVRGHQVRMKYKEFIWTVGVVEKVVLRWRRGGVGLRGFRAEPETMDEEDGDVVRVFRKERVGAALDQAVTRVLSMVESPEARLQYRRMLEGYRQAKAELNHADESTGCIQHNLGMLEVDGYGMY